jgi:hypothetical protein
LSHLKNIFLQFVYIIAGNTIGVAVYISIVSHSKTVPSSLLWQIILVSAICALGYLIGITTKELSKWTSVVKQILHYIYINTVVLASAKLFKWMDIDSISQVLVMILLITVIYIIIITIIYLQDTETADRVNKKLIAFHSEDETDN